VAGISGKQLFRSVFMLMEFLTRNLFLCFEEEKALVIFGARERWQDTLKALLLSLMIKHMLMARTSSNRPGSSTNRDLLSHRQKTNLVFLHLMLLELIRRRSRQRQRNALTTTLFLS
jgi:hypothetical protein